MCGGTADWALLAAATGAGGVGVKYLLGLNPPKAARSARLVI